MMAGSNPYINRYQHYDANLDRGYGRLTPKFHKPRAFVQYPEPPKHDLKAEAEVEDDTYYAVLKRLLDYQPSDPYAVHDPFHYVDGTTKFTESTAKGMVPFPKMYSARQAVVGGTAPRSPGGPTLTFRTRIPPTGTKRGWSKSPPDIYTADNENEEIQGFADILNTNYDERHIDLIKKMVNLIHLEQEQQKVSSASDTYK
jgi:hypothetical protein